VFSPEKSSTWVKDDRTKYYNGSASNEGWDYLNAENYKGSWPEISYDMMEGNL
jgi:hypothetical protein